MKYFNLLILLFPFLSVFAQPNCEAYKYYGDTLKYDACKKAMEIKPVDVIEDVLKEALV